MYARSQPTYSHQYKIIINLQSLPKLVGTPHEIPLPCRLTVSALKLPLPPILPHSNVVIDGTDALKAKCCNPGQNHSETLR